ncbi:hypothetical protein BH23ACT10_BH23ACT10_24790 [soil metagenome]
MIFVVKWVLLAGAVGVFVFGGVVAWFYVSGVTDSSGKVAFSNEVAIPELLEPAIAEDGAKVFDAHERVPVEVAGARTRREVSCLVGLQCRARGALRAPGRGALETAGGAAL